jgi:hypothetical protein
MSKKTSISRKYLENLVKETFKRGLAEQTASGFGRSRANRARYMKKSFPKSFTDKFSESEVTEILLTILVGMPASRDQVTSFAKNKVKYGLSDYSATAAAMEEVEGLTGFEQVIFRFLKIVSLSKDGEPNRRVKMQWNKELFDKLSNACIEGERIILNQFDETVKQDRTSLLPQGLFPTGPRGGLGSIGALGSQEDRVNDAFGKFLNKIYEIYDDYNIIDETGILATGYESGDLPILTRKASKETVGNFHSNYGRKIHRRGFKGAESQSGYKPVRKILETEVIRLSKPFRDAKIENFLQLRRYLAYVFGDNDDVSGKVERSEGSRFRVYRAVATKQNAEKDNDPASLFKSFLDVGISLYTSVSLVGLAAKPLLGMARMSPEISKLFLKTANSEVSKRTLKDSINRLFTTKVGLKKLADVIITIPVHFSISFDQLDREISARLAELQALHSQYFKFLDYTPELGAQQKKFIEFCKDNPGQPGPGGQTCPSDPGQLTSYLTAPFSTSFKAIGSAYTAASDAVSPTKIEDTMEDIKGAWASIYNEMIKVNLLLASVNDRSSASEGTVIDMQGYQKNVINDPKNKEGLESFLEVITKIYSDARSSHKVGDEEDVKNQFVIGNNKIVEVINFHNEIQEKSNIIKKQISKMKAAAQEMKKITTLNSELNEDAQETPAGDGSTPMSDVVGSVIAQLPEKEQLVDYGPLTVNIGSTTYVLNFDGDDFRLNEKVFNFVSVGLVNKDVHIESSIRQGDSLTVILGALGMSTKIELTEENVVEMLAAALVLSTVGQEYSMNMKDKETGDDEQGKIVLKRIDNNYPKPEEPKQASPAAGGISSIVVIGDSNAIRMAQTLYKTGDTKKDSEGLVFLKDGDNIVSPVIGSGQPSRIDTEVESFLSQKSENYSPTTAIIHMGYNNPKSALRNIESIINTLKSYNINDIRIIDVKASKPKDDTYISNVKKLSDGLKRLSGVTIIKNEEKNGSDGYHFSSESHDRLLKAALAGIEVQGTSGYDFKKGSDLKYRVPKVNPAVKPNNWDSSVGNGGDWVKFRNFLGGVEGSGIYNIKGGDGDLYDGVYQFGVGAKKAFVGTQAAKMDAGSRTNFRMRFQGQENALTEFTKSSIIRLKPTFVTIDEAFEDAAKLKKIKFILPDEARTSQVEVDTDTTAGKSLISSVRHAIKQGLLATSHNLGPGKAIDFFDANWPSRVVFSSADLPVISLKVGNGEHEWKSVAKDGFGNKDSEHFIKVVKIKLELIKVSDRPEKFKAGYNPTTNEDYSLVKMSGGVMTGFSISKKESKKLPDLSVKSTPTRNDQKKQATSGAVNASPQNLAQDVTDVNGVTDFFDFVSVFGAKYFPKFDVSGKSMMLKKDRRDIEKTDLSQFANKKKEQLKNNYLARNKRQILKLTRKKEPETRNQLLSLEGRVRIPVYFPAAFLRYNKRRGYTMFFELENLEGIKGKKVENGDITIVPARNPQAFESIKFIGKSQRYIDEIQTALKENIRLLKFFLKKLDSFSQQETEVEYLTMEDRAMYREFIKNLIEIFEIGLEAIIDRDSSSTIRRAWKVVNLAAVIYLIP